MWWKMILLVILGLMVIITVALVYGSSRWQSSTKEMHTKLEAERIPIAPRTYDSRELNVLPAPVQSYFRAVLKDGQKDYVLFVCLKTGSDGYDHYLLEVNGEITAGRGEELDGLFKIVDIDTTDKLKEIAIPESGPSDDYVTSLYYYDGSSLVFMGSFPGTYDFKVDGSGEVRTVRRGSILHTWSYPARYRLAAGHKLVPVEEQFYPMNCHATVLTQLALQASPTDSRIAYILRRGQRVNILGSDDRKWCLVETEDGVRGWFAVEDYSLVVGTGKQAHEVFDGLWYAD
jgi:hypothetical protein